jgi:hypothetical protein
MTISSISSYALTSNDLSTSQGSKSYANALNAIRDDISKFSKVAKQSIDNSAPNPVAPAVVLDISGTAKTALKS